MTDVPVETATRPRDRRGLVALVLSCLWFAGLGSVAGLLLGASVLFRKPLVEERDRALAHMATVIGGFGLAVALGLVVFNPRDVPEWSSRVARVLLGLELVVLAGLVLRDQLRPEPAASRRILGWAIFCAVVGPAMIISGLLGLPLR